MLGFVPMVCLVALTSTSLNVITRAQAVLAYLIHQHPRTGGKSGSVYWEVHHLQGPFARRKRIRHVRSLSEPSWASRGGSAFLVARRL